MANQQPSYHAFTVVKREVLAREHLNQPDNGAASAFGVQRADVQGPV